MTCIVYGQNVLQTEEYKAIIRIKDEHEQCKKLIQLGTKKDNVLEEYDNALMLFEKAELLTRKKSCYDLKPNLYLQWANCLTRIESFELAKEKVELGLNSPAIKKKPLVKAKLLNTKGAILQNLFFYKKALQAYNESAYIYTRIRNPEGEAAVYGNIATTFKNTGNFKEAKQFFLKSERIMLKHSLWDEYITSVNNRANMLSQLNDYRGAKNLLIQALTIDKGKLKKKEVLVFTYLNLGLICGELNEWQNAFDFLDKGKELTDEWHLSEANYFDYFHLKAYLLAKKGNKSEAISNYKKAISIKQNSKEAYSLYNEISEIYRQQKQLDSALYYQTKRVTYFDSIYETEIHDQAKFQGQRLQMMSENYRKELQNNKQRYHLINLKKTNYLYLSIIISLFIFLLFIILYYRQAKLKARKEHLQSEVDFLKSQMNPHFLFNSINNIYVLMEEDKESAANILLNFSDLMRYQLYECNVQEIQLSKEIAFINNYLAFEEMRYSNTIELALNIQSVEKEKYSIAPLLIQPFIENAFKHAPKQTKNKSVISIEISVKDSYMRLVVTNPYLPDQSSNLPGGIGLNNVKKRLKLLYPKHHKLIINNQNEQFRIELELKLKNL